MNKAELNNLRTKAAQSSSLQEVGALLTQVESAIQRGDMRYQDSGGAFLSIYGAVRRLTEGEPQAGWRFLFDSLLPLYIQAGNVKNQGKRFELHQCRELADEWLNDYRGDDAEELLGRALNYFADHLDPKDRSVFERACWAIQGIGYRDSHVIARLRALLPELPGVRGDDVLRAIVDMGVPAADQTPLRQELHRRVRRRLNPSLIHALRDLADESTFELLFGAKPPRSMIEADANDLDWLMSVLSSIAERVGAGALCDEVVRTIERLYRQHTTALSSSVYLGGYLLPHCDSPETTRFIAALVAQKEETEDKTAHALWLLDHRLSACVRPAQQAGMDQTLSPEAVAALQNEALKPGTHTERGATFQGDVKRCAVNTALTFGTVEALSWFTPILDTEGNNFVLHDLMESYSAFGFEPLPAKIKHWITEEKDVGKSDPDAEWLLRTAASSMARTTGSEEAFDALLHPGFTLQGDVMRSTVDGLAGVALTLAQRSASSANSVIERLLAALKADPIPPQASAVCRSLSILAAEGHLPSELSGTILDHAKRESLKIYPRSQLVSALGFFPEVRHSEQTTHWLAQIAEDNDDWLGWRALEALARLKTLTEVPGDLPRKFGLNRDGENWVWLKDRPQFQWTAGIVAQLYAHQPLSFAPAVTAILRDGDYAQVAQLLSGLEAPLDPAVAQALVDHIKLSNTPRMIEFGLFMYLGRLAPDRLVSEDWPALWTNWLPEVRIDLADAFCRCWPGTDFPAEESLRLLVPLLGDGHFGVRRAAARALGRIVPGALFAFCNDMARSERVADRIRAAELSVWMPAASRDISWHELKDALLSDRHKAVRASATQANLADKRRAWGMEHLGKVLSLREAHNAAMLACWRHGRALTHTGDDEALWLLTEHLEREKPPLNVRYFQSSVAKGLEKLWRDTVKKKWPEPVAPSRGSTETGEGVYIAPSGTRYPVQYTVWRLAATIEHAGTRWGGSVQAKNGQRFEDGLLTKEGVFQSEDGRRAKIHFITIHNSVAAIFSGSGDYPMSQNSFHTPNETT